MSAEELVELHMLRIFKAEALERMTENDLMIKVKSERIAELEAVVVRAEPMSDTGRWADAAMPPEIELRLAPWLTNGAALHPLTTNLVVRFARALAAKLAAAEVKYGFSDGWRDPGWMDECRSHLVDHVAKGDPRDVAAYCAFLWHHGESTKPDIAVDAGGSVHAPTFVIGSCKELNDIHAVIMDIGSDWPEADGDPYTLAHVKEMAREIRAEQGDAMDAERYRFWRNCWGREQFLTTLSRTITSLSTPLKKSDYNNFDIVSDAAILASKVGAT